MTFSGFHVTDGSVQTPANLSGNLLLGTDLVFIPRLTMRYERHGRKFFTKLLTETELFYCEANSSVRTTVFIQKVAARIAVKEAVAKALGCGVNGLGWGQGIHWKEIETISQNQSPPHLVLTGRALEISLEFKVKVWRFSLSHDGDYAMATVIGLI
jgi:holo-[acyl-carrier protein] synthase